MTADPSLAVNKEEPPNPGYLVSCLIELLDAILDSPLQHPEGVMARPTGILYETPNPASSARLFFSPHQTFGV